MLTTPAYGLTYCTPDDPLANLAAASQALAETTEEALMRGGIAPPEAQDLAALAGRVTTLETRVTALEHPVDFLGYPQAAQSLLDGWRDVVLDAEGPDTDSAHALGSAYFTAPRAGWYWVQGCAAYLPNATGARGGRLVKRVGATDSNILGSAVLGATVGTSAPTMYATPMRRVALNAGDQIKLQGFHSAGAGVSLGLVTAAAGSSPDQATFLQITYAHPL